nr:hypothetical protein [Amycolatopsis acididurans]
MERLLRQAAEFSLRAPELVLVLGERAAALAETADSDKLWVRAEGLVVAARVRLGLRADTVGRAVAVLRAAEDLGEIELGARLRTDLAVCARSVGAPLTGLAALRPVLATTAFAGADKAAALCQLVGCLSQFGRKPELDRAFVEADKLCGGDDSLDGDDRLLARAYLRVGMSAHRRRHADTLGAGDAARTGLGLLEQLDDPGRDGGVVRSRLILHLVCSLLDRGDMENALEIAQPLLDEPVRAAATAPLGWLRMAVATRILLPSGGVEAAAGMLRDAVYSTERHGLHSLTSRLWAELSNVEQRLGRADEAIECLHQTRAAEHLYARSRRQAMGLLTGEFGNGGHASVDLDEILGVAPRAGTATWASNEQQGSRELRLASVHGEAPMRTADEPGKATDERGQTAGEDRRTDADFRSIDGDHRETGGDRREVDGDHRAAGGDRRELDGDHRAAGGDRREVDGDHRAAGGDRWKVDGDHREAGGDRSKVDADRREASGNSRSIDGDHRAADGDHWETRGDHRETRGVSRGSDTSVSAADESAHKSRKFAWDDSAGVPDLPLAPAPADEPAHRFSLIFEPTPAKSDTARQATNGSAGTGKTSHNDERSEAAHTVNGQPERRHTAGGDDGSATGTAPGVEQRRAAHAADHGSVTGGAASSDPEAGRREANAAVGLDTGAAEGSGASGRDGGQREDSSGDGRGDSPVERGDTAAADAGDDRTEGPASGSTVGRRRRDRAANHDDAVTDQHEDAANKPKTRHDSEHGSVAARSVLDRLGISPGSGVGGRRRASDSDPGRRREADVGEETSRTASADSAEVRATNEAAPSADAIHEAPDVVSETGNGAGGQDRSGVKASAGVKEQNAGSGKHNGLDLSRLDDADSAVYAGDGGSATGAGTGSEPDAGAAAKAAEAAGTASARHDAAGRASTERDVPQRDSVGAAEESSGGRRRARDRSAEDGPGQDGSVADASVEDVSAARDSAGEGTRRVASGGGESAEDDSAHVDSVEAGSGKDAAGTTGSDEGRGVKVNEDWLPKLRLPPSLEPFDDHADDTSPAKSETHFTSTPNIEDDGLQPFHAGQSTSFLDDDLPEDAGLADLLARALAEHQAGTTSAAALVKRLGTGDDATRTVNGHSRNGEARGNGRHRTET